MKLIDKYILFEWGKAFFLSFAAIVFVIVMGVMYDDLVHLLDYGATFSQIVLIYINIIPGLFPIIVPVALLISLLFVLGNLHRNSEIVAMRAMGLSIFRITRSLWVMGVLITLLMVYFNAELIPKSMERSKGVEDQMRYQSEAKAQSGEDVGLIYRLAFDNAKENRLWYINRMSGFTKKAFGVSVF